LYLTVGYGYRTWLGGLWLAGFLLAATIVAAVAHTHQVLTAAEPIRKLQHFNPLVYALDLLLPIVNLGAGGRLGAPPLGGVVFLGVHPGGVVLTTTVVAGLAGVLKRD
jgi:hypothetical protein